MDRQCRVRPLAASLSAVVLTAVQPHERVVDQILRGRGFAGEEVREPK